MHFAALLAVVTPVAIPACAAACCLLLQVIDDKECNRRAEEAKARNEPHFYMMEMAPGQHGHPPAAHAVHRRTPVLQTAVPSVCLPPAPPRGSVGPGSQHACRLHHTAAVPCFFAVFPPLLLLLLLPPPRPSAAAGLIIDARSKGNLARLLNSSCDPNCETQKWHDASNSEVGMPPSLKALLRGRCEAGAGARASGGSCPSVCCGSVPATPAPCFALSCVYAGQQPCLTPSTASHTHPQ